MISYFQMYDHWAKMSRLAGLEEWPEPGTNDIWAGKLGVQQGLWDGDLKYGVICTTTAEFNDWVLERDLPPGYTKEVSTPSGNIRHFYKEPQ